MITEPNPVDRWVNKFESELEILVEQYRVGPVGLPPQGLAEVFGRFFVLECLGGYGCRHSTMPVRGLSRSSMPCETCPKTSRGRCALNGLCFRRILPSFELGRCCVSLGTLPRREGREHV